MRLLCTIAAGDAIDYGSITVPRMYAYAKRCGADFYAVTRRTHGPVWDATNKCEGGPSMWKLNILRWFTTQSHYARLAFVDADTFIRKDSPSIFDVLDDGSGFYAAQDMNNERELPLWKAWAEERYKFEITLPFYANAGIWVTDQRSARCMTSHMDGFFEEVHTRFQEQDYLNLIARYSNVTRELPSHFNVPYPYMTQNPDDGHFLHACGLAQQDKLAWFTKLEALGI